MMLSLGAARVTFIGESENAGEAKLTSSKDFSFHRKAVTVVTVFIVILWLVSGPQRLEAWAMRIITIASVLTTVAIWSSWRFKFYSFSFLYVTFAFASVLVEDYAHHSVFG
jgi:hypothetical protein